MISRPRLAALLPLFAVLVAGCGGGGDSSVSASTRVERCLDKQPEATKSECEGWESDGQLADDGTHEGHENM
jgi:hypothetical protein